MQEEPTVGIVYKRKTDGTRLRFSGRPGMPRADFFVGWEANGPTIFGKIVGEAWGWPWMYEVDPDQSWVVQEAQ